MKKFTKVCLLICAVLLTIGIILCMVGVGLGFSYQQLKRMAQEGVFSWNKEIDISFGDNAKKNHSGSHHTTGEDWTNADDQWAADKIRNLDIQFDFGTLILEPAAGENIEVQLGYRSKWDNYRRAIGWEVQGDTLRIKDTLEQKIFKLFHHGDEDAVLTIRIPEGKVFDEAFLEIGAASVSMETELAATELELVIGAGEMINKQEHVKMLQAEELCLEIGAGNMVLSGVQAESMNVECGAGNIELTDVSAADVDMDCGVGKITMELNHQEKDYDYEIDCGIGQVVVGDSSYSGLGQSKTIENNGNKSMDIDCGIGEIVISFQ